MSLDDVERSESGDPIYRYEAPDSERGFEPPEVDDEAINVIEEHIKKHVGDGDGQSMVFHELISDTVHIDVHIIPPTEEQNFYTLITTGMSDRPMNVPQEAIEVRGDVRYAELLICLPSDWRLEESDLEHDENYWPIGTLKFLARFPHLYDTWLGSGHTVPNGDPPVPFAENVGFSGVIMVPPVGFGDEFTSVVVRPDKTVHFYALIPLYQEEMDYKLKYGADALLELLDEIGVSELLEPNRKNVCKTNIVHRPRRRLN
jgi:hypothetical protein